MSIQFSYYRNIHASHMILTPALEGEPWEKEMLWRNRPGELILPEYNSRNGQTQLWYDITGKQAVDMLAELSDISYEIFIKICEAVVAMAEVLDGLLISPDILLLRPESIFFDNQGLRNARLNFRQQEPTHIMENIVYNELLIRGYNVDVGVVQIFDKDKEGKRVRKQLEVDFVVNQGNQRYYIQVAYDMTSEEKQNQEFNSLRNIPDSFKKVVIVNGSKRPWRNDEGFVIMGMKYFLLNADSLEF